MKKFFLYFVGLIVILIFLSIILTFMEGKASSGQKIGVVDIEGPIFKSEDIVDEIKEYREDDSIKAIIIRVNSPGGAVVPSQEIYDEVKETVKKKKVVISMGSLAASGGYYLSAPASKIIANPGTLTGSIGVIMELPNLKGFMEKIGVKNDVIKSGRYKDLASIFRGIGDEERGILQNVLDDVHEQFIQAVASGRKMPYEKVKGLADGRIFTGRQALALGLVDSIGDFQFAVKETGKLAGIKGEPKIVSKKDELSILHMLNNKVSLIYNDIFSPMSLKYMIRL
ncbi:MAG: signal peptide peptidase SppA [Nitrospirae bacterium]|nr:signal peptide peptidase SppA [Nitrospirota bacterium]